MEEEKKDNPPSWSSTIKEQEEEQKFTDDKKEELDMPDRLKRFLDIPLHIEVVVGSTVMSLGELLYLAPGSVIELEQNVETPVDIKVNGKLIAKGEIVIVEDRFGVRIIEIVTKEERIKGVV